MSVIVRIPSLTFSEYTENITERPHKALYQLRDLPQPCDVAVLSVGGNDALAHLDLLESSVSNASEVLETLSDITLRSSRNHGVLVDALRSVVRRVVLCTIYEPPMFDDVSERLARVVLSLLNDHIVRTATAAGMEVIELRLVCTDENDFVQDIEPSLLGAEKLADAIVAVVSAPGQQTSSTVFAT